MARNIKTSKRGWGYDPATETLRAYVDGQEALRLKGTIMPIDSVTLFDDFLSQQTLVETETPWVMNSGTDTAQAKDPVIVTTQVQNGVLYMASGDTDGVVSKDGSQVVGDMPWKAEQGSLVFECRLHINSAITTVQVVVGLTDTQSLEEPAAVSGTTIATTMSDGCVFVYDTDAGTDQWHCAGVDSNTEATGNAICGIAPEADTYQVLRIEIDKDGAGARFYIDDALVGTLTADACSPDVALYPTVLLNSTTSTQRTVDVDYIYVSARRA